MINFILDLLNIIFESMFNAAVLTVIFYGLIVFGITGTAIYIYTSHRGMTLKEWLDRE